MSCEGKQSSRCSGCSHNCSDFQEKREWLKLLRFQVLLRETGTDWGRAFLCLYALLATIVATLLATYIMFHLPNQATSCGARQWILQKEGDTVQHHPISNGLPHHLAYLQYILLKLQQRTLGDIGMDNSDELSRQKRDAAAIIGCRLLYNDTMQKQPAAVTTEAILKTPSSSSSTSDGRSKPAALVVGDVMYEWDNIHDPGSRLEWKEKPGVTYMRGVILNLTRNGLVVEQDGFYYVFAHLQFDDHRRKLYILNLLRNNERISSASSPNPLIWRQGKDGRRYVSRRTSQTFTRDSRGAPILPRNSLILDDQLNAFRKTVHVQTLVWLRQGDIVTVKPNCLPGSDRHPCKVVLKHNRRKPVNQLGLFMV